MLEKQKGQWYSAYIKRNMEKIERGNRLGGAHHKV